MIKNSVTVNGNNAVITDSVTANGNNVVITQ